MQRGEIWWAELPEPSGSAPAYSRPVLVIQNDRFNESRINTVIVAAITSNLRLASAPGNVPLPRTESGLPKDSVINVSQILTIDKAFLNERVCSVTTGTMRAVNGGLRLVIALES